MRRWLFAFKAVFLPAVLVGGFLSLSALDARASTIVTPGPNAFVFCSDSAGLGGSSCPSGDAGAFQLGTSMDGVTGFGLDTSNQTLTGDEHHTSCDSSNSECTETVTIVDRVTASGSDIAPGAALPISWDFLVGANGTGSLTIVSYDVSLSLGFGPSGTGFSANSGTVNVGTTINTGSTDSVSGTANGTTNASHGIETTHDYTAVATISVVYYQHPTGDHNVQISLEVPDQSVDFASTGSTVPEPATLGIVGLGLAALGWIGNRRRRAI